MALVLTEWRATGGLNRGMQTKHLGHSSSIQRIEGGENKGRRDWVARMAGGAQKPGLRWTRKAAVGPVRMSLRGSAMRADGLGREEGRSEEKQKHPRWAREL